MWNTFEHARCRPKVQGLSLFLPPSPSACARPAAGLRNVWEPCVKSPDCGKVLLSAELPPPSLPLSFSLCRPPSLSHFVGRLSRRAPWNAPSLCEYVCACVCLCMWLSASQHTGSKLRASASGVELPLPADGFNANTKFSAKHTDTYLFKLKQATSSSSNRTTKKQDGPLSFCLSLNPVFLTLPFPLKHKHWYTSLYVYMLMPHSWLWVSPFLAKKAR